MTNNIRVFIWVGLALALFLNYTQWQADYGPKPTPATAATSVPGAPKPTSLDDTVPQVAQAPTTGVAAGSAAPAAATPSAEAPAETGAAKVRVTTDVLVLDISLRGGTLVYAALPAYPVNKGQPEPVVLFREGDPATNYELQSGLAGTPAEGHPTHMANFASAQDHYEFATGQDELRVPLTWTDGNGVTVAKTFVFHRGSYAIGLEYSVHNTSAAPWNAASYVRISRVDPKVESSMWKIESRTFRGPAIYDPAGKKYQKFDIEKPENQNLSLNVQNGWIAGLQHHFATAVVPDPTRTYAYSLRAEGRHYILGALGPVQIVAPGGTSDFKETLFVGPKLQKQLVTVTPELDLVADYGALTLLARPLFKLLEFVHSLVKNWGVAIILATLILKLFFYPLAQYAGRSMARMRKLTPRIKALQETYKDDREKLGRAMMDLYKTEKANPLTGCLPMLIQMPVFFAFYYVLLESVEMRQAPFVAWITDLSSRDPFFILPAINGLLMYLQYKLNPPPPDPMQAKVFQFMPLVFSVLFAVFPAGLVLYWVTNTGLSILQQWNINRHIEAEDRARKK